jgi:hypothetical protein
MAIANDEEEQTKNMFRSVGGGTSYIGGGYAGGGGAQQAQTPRSEGPGSGFTNIQEYLKGPERSAQAGQEIAKGTDTLGGEALTKLSDFEKEGAAISNVPEYDPSVGGSWLYDVSTFGVAPGQTAAFNKPVPTFGGGNMINGYADVLSFQPAQDAASKLERNLKLNKTEEGLTSQFKGTPGEQRLSTALAMNTPGRQAIEGAQQKWGQIGGWLNKSQTGVQNQIVAGKENAAKWENAAQLARDKAGETNKIYGDLATAKQKNAAAIAAMQPGAGAGNYTTPAVVPAPAPAAPSGSKGKSDAERFAERWIKPDTDRMLTPTPGGLSSDGLRRSEPGRLSKEAQQGGYYYIKNNPVSKGLTKTSEWITGRLG